MTKKTQNCDANYSNFERNQLDIHFDQGFITYYCLYSKYALSVSKFVSQANRTVYLMHILQKSAWIFRMDSGC